MPSLSSIRDQLEVILRGGACVLAGIPSTTLVPLPLTQALTRRYEREDRLRRLHLMIPWAAFCRRRLLRIELEVRGREHLPASRRGHMIVCNHQSWADIIVLMEALDTVAFLAKSLVKRIPIIGRCAYAAGTVYVERDDPESRRRALREVIRMCQQSTAVVIFPEGTRSPDGELQRRLHTASLHAAFNHRLRVIPVAIDGTYRVLPKSMDRCRPGRVAVCIGPALEPTAFNDSSAFSTAVWGRVTELFEEARAMARG